MPGMDETSLRGLLETALGDEPPIGPVAGNSLRLGIKLRRRIRLRRAAGGAAVVVAMAAVIPAVIGIHGHTGAGVHPGATRKGTGQVSYGGGGTPRPAVVGQGTAYVINSGGGTVTPIDLATDTPGKPIEVSGEPVAMAITPDGKTAYVASGATNSGAEPTLAQTMTAIDLTTNTPGKPIDLQWSADAIVITPDGKTAYLINGFPSRTLTAVDLTTNTPGKSITLRGEPVAIAMARDGKAYVCTVTTTGTPSDSRTVYEFMSLDLATGALGKPVKLSGQPGAVAIAPDGKTAYVAIYSSGAVTPIDLATNTAGKPIKVSGRPKAMMLFGQPMAIAIAPDGKTAYVANGASGTVTPIDLATDTPGKPISISGKPGADAIAITPDGTAAYVANQPSSTVTPIDLATNTPGKPIKIGHGWDSGFEAIVIAP
jgi:YVTN family beta-propeller protein